ncbi:MAG: replicative DNA helicase [Lachnospiraceae bacterium]|nr:replicative DNA helicase [Lachnospiraceae bacterium]
MDNQVVKLSPPHDKKAELAVLGSILMDSENISTISEMIGKDDFYTIQYGEIFNVLVQMYKDKVEIDAVTLAAKLREKDVPPEFYSADFLSSLYDSVPTSTNAKYYARIIYEKSQARRLIKASQYIMNEAYSGKAGLEELLDDAEKRIFNITQRRIGSDFEPISDIMLEALSSIEEAYKNGGVITGIPTGFTDLDLKLSGFHKSEFILVAARPAMGKTAFVLNIAEHVAVAEKKNVAIFNLEMSKEQLAKRLLSMESNVSASKIKIGDLNTEEWKDIVNGVTKLGDSNLYICCQAGITLPEIKSKCRKLQIESGLDMVIIDYLQLMQSDSRSRSQDNRQQEISDISRGLKIMAMELDIPVVTLSQCSRAVENRSDKRPMLSDLRESGAIEQDADIVMFIYRDDYYNQNSEDKGVAEIIVAKHRNGEVGTEKLAWVGKYTKFSNLDKSYYENGNNQSAAG